MRAEEAKEKLIQVEISGGTDLEMLAGMLEMKPIELLSMNRQFKRGIVPRDKALYTLMILEEKMILFYLKYELKTEQKRFKLNLLSHVVQMGDILENIAQKYHSSAEEIKTANKLEDEFLELGSILLVPVSREVFEKMLQAQLVGKDTW